MNEWVMLGIGLLLTVGTGIFVASEFALVNLNRHDLETRAARGEKRLGPTISALRITSTHLSSAQLGITLTTLLTGYTFEPAVTSLLQGPLGALGVPASATTAVGAIVGILLATLFSMVIGELVPKNFALALPLGTAKVVIPFQAAFTTVFKPVVLLLNNTANALIRKMGVEPKEELTAARTADELGYLIRHSATAGVLEHADAALLAKTLRFANYDAADMMTPRVRMSTVHRHETAAAILATSSHTGHSRLPVLDDGPDDIVGIVHVKQAFAVHLSDRDRVTAADLMSPPTRVPETQGAPALLTHLRQEGLQIAVVTDEHGGTAGLVTLEDLIEEIVGELQDEHDRFRAGITRQGRAITFEPNLRPDELKDRTGIEIPDDGDWDTVAGFVAARLGRVSEAGDEVTLPDGTLRVERIDGARIARIRFLPHEQPAAPPGPDRTDPTPKRGHHG